MSHLYLKEHRSWVPNIDPTGLIFSSLLVTVQSCICCNLQMSQKIEELEKAALAEKPWQLSGEVTAQTRPENSMLEEDVAFEQTSRTG